jgi:pyruvate/2-oxoglutarate/acetoin dehydrogenase E1 component
VLGEDVGRGGIFGQYKGLQQRFGAERVIDTPISEAAIMGAGVGMALRGCGRWSRCAYVDFALCGMDEMVNQAAKNRFMFGGQGRVPMVVRMPIGIWGIGGAALAVAGNLVRAPARRGGGVPADAAGQPRPAEGALPCGDPVVYMEHKTLWGERGEVDEAVAVPWARRAGARTGNDVTLVSWSQQCRPAPRPATLLAAARHRRRPDRPAHAVALGPRDGAVSCARTGRLLVVHEAVQAAGFGAEIAASAAGGHGCRVARLGAPRIPVGYAPVLEAQSRVGVEAIVAAAKKLAG